MSRPRTRQIEKDVTHVSDDYLGMVKAFPLRPLRTKMEHTAAGAILDRFIGRDDLTPGQQDYLAALVLFVEDYEHEQRAAWMRRQTPLQLLKHLMVENDMNTSDLGYVLGSRGLASEVLNGKRALSKALIARLANRFGVEPGLFLDIN
jgi:HTH-type transcriptional regulator / antitoxin HigA